MRTENVHTRNSRWGDAPLLDAGGRSKVALIIERYVERIFSRSRAIAIYRPTICRAWAAGSSRLLVNRLALLARKPNSYVARPQQQRANASANCRRQIYELSEKGVRLMHERGLICERSRTPSSFAHELMICQLMASFELGIRETGTQLIDLDRYSAKSNLPDATRRSPTPFRIPVTVTIDAPEPRPMSSPMVPRLEFAPPAMTDPRTFLPRHRGRLRHRAARRVGFSAIAAIQEICSLSDDRDARHPPLAFWFPQFLHPDRHHQHRAPRLDDAPIAPDYRRRRFANQSVQNLSGFHVAGETAGTIGPRADRRLAARWPSPVQLPDLVTAATMSDKPPSIDVVAAREPSITSRRTRVHVIVCHDLNARSYSLSEMFRFADRVSPDVLDALTRELAEDIIRDADILIAELRGIKAYAERQLEKLPRRSTRTAHPFAGVTLRS